MNENNGFAKGQTLGTAPKEIAVWKARLILDTLFPRFLPMANNSV